MYLIRRNRKSCVLLGAFSLCVVVGMLNDKFMAEVDMLKTAVQPIVTLDKKDVNIPESLRGLIKSPHELGERHSDYINQSECEDPEKKYPWKTDPIYDFIGPFDYLSNYKNPCFLNENQNLNCVPYFYLIGAPKAGSTDIFNRITTHPQALSGRGKEIRWFDRRRFGEALTYPKYKSFSGYLDFFSKATSVIKASVDKDTDWHKKVIGDGGPTYYFSSYYWKQVPGNEGCSEPRVTSVSHIHHLWPHAKLILILRNPVTRLFSSYHFNARVTGANRTSEQFHEWTNQTFHVWNDCLREHSFRYCMYEGAVDWKSKLLELHIGLYSRYVLDVLKIFPRKQLMVVHLEDYSINTVQWMKDIFNFLELDPMADEQLKVISQLKTKNVNRKKSTRTQMLETTKKILTDFYSRFNRELADILKDNRFLWLDS